MSLPRLLIFLLLGAALAACSSHQRVMSVDETLRHGLTGVIYDAPLCPTEFKDGASRVSGPCEYVTCEPKAGRLVCIARKH